MEPLDMVGKPCPIPVIEAKKALARATPGDTLVVLVDNDIARQNLHKMADGMGHSITHETAPDGNIRVSVAVCETCSPARENDDSGLVVAIGRDRMGDGSDELGQTLMKSFIFSLTELDTPPEHILFYNGGARLTCAGSGALNDLAALADKGVTISTCGACLNYYGLVDQLTIGSSTNMFAIASVMAAARKLINL